MASTTFNMGAVVTMRDMVGNHLTDMGEKYPNMAVVVSDMMSSSRTHAFTEAYPDRYFNVGIAEQQLMSFSAGLAHEGYIPFAFTFAAFASMRSTEQVRTDIAYSNLPVRIIANNAGYSMAISGATHSALEDCAIYGSIANMTVIEPGDPMQIVKVLDATMDWEGPVYIRMGREATTSLYQEDQKYEIGKALIPRQGNDAAFIVSGIVVHFAMEAANRLKEDYGVNIRIVDMHTIKPLDKEATIDAAKTGNVICAQDHNILGGLGTYVGTAIAEAGISCNFKILGCPNEFVPLATPEYLYKINEYDVDGLYKNMKEMLKL